MIWLQRFMEELGKKQENSRLYSDNQISIHLAKNSAFHSKTKHIQLKYHFIRSVLDEELLKLERIHTSQNPVDMLTKGVTREKLSSCSVLLAFKHEGENKKLSKSKVQSIVQQVQQWWSCRDQSPSGRLLVVDPDLPDP